MKENRKKLAIAIIVLIVGAGVVPSISGIGSVSTVIYPPIITIDGTIGENDWYISCVTITFSVIDPEIDYIMYKIDDGEWITFTGPFVICEDGEHTICWYYVDNEGNQSCPEYVDFKIDQKSPTIELTVEKIGSDTWLFTADVYDETSGVNRVEFYVDEKFVGTVTEAPYEWEWNGIGNGHIVQAIVCDNAGNYGISHSPPSIPKTRVFGIIRNPEFTEETVSLFAIVVVSNTCPPCILRQLTFQNDYSGYIGERFIFAVFEYGPC